MSDFWSDANAALSRTAIATKEDSEEEVKLLSQLKDAKGKFRIYNSLLSEYAVLGF
jgi:2-oxoglutarate dehydrogenase E1 component